MFERFDEPARQVVVLAQDEARRLRHNYIGTEHMLLGLVRDRGPAGRALGELGVHAEHVRGEVAKIIGSGDEAPAGQIPFTPRSKKVLELGLREALDLGSDHIGPEHILLGLVRENGGVAAQILYDRGVTARGVAGAIPGVPGDHASRFSDAAPEARGVSDHGRFAALERSSSSPGVAAAVGIALAVGILIGWLIWG
jgi:ATP-dependent Clp protease ATP-binding subunit ClpC